MMGSNITKAQMREAWGRGISLEEYETMRTLREISHQEAMDFFDMRSRYSAEDRKKLPSAAPYVKLRRQGVSVAQLQQAITAGYSYEYMNAISAGIKHEEVMQVLFKQYDLGEYVSGRTLGLSHEHMIEVMKIAPRHGMSHGMKRAVEAGLDHEKLIHLLKGGFGDFDFRNYIQLIELGVPHDRIVEVFKKYKTRDYGSGFSEYARGRAMGLSDELVVTELEKRSNHES
jgi:hypothetical protein